MKNYPVIKFTILFAIGITLQHLFNFNLTILYLFISGIIFYVLLNLSKNPGNYTGLLKLLLFVLVIISFGISVAILNGNKTNQLPQEIIHNTKTEIYGTIKEINLIQCDQLKFEIITDSIVGDNIKLSNQYILQCRLKVQISSLNKFYKSIYPGYQLKIASTIFETRDKRNPGEFDYKEYLLANGISGNVNISRTNQIEIIGRNINYFPAVIFSIRKNIASKIDQIYSAQPSSLLKGLLLADRSNISYSTKEEFINAGVIHVLAVSGLHVGFISLIVIILIGRINLFSRSIITIIALILFLLITGSPPSVFRAVIMGSIIILSFVFGRSTNIFNSLSIAGLIILLIEPQQLFSPGFQLSFSAVWGIAVFFPMCREYLTKLGIENKSIKYILLFISVSLGAQIGTLPFTLIYFGKLSIIALAVNLIVIPLIGIIIATGIISLLIYIIIPFVAIYYASANELFSKILFWLISKTGNLDFSFIKLSNFNFYDAAIIFVSIFFLLFIWKKLFKPFAKIIVSGLLIINVFLFTSITSDELLPENKLSILMIDVGQGDAILIKYPNGKISLIDAGIWSNNFDTGKYILEPLLNYLNIDKIDAAYLSHMDIDHYGGFNYLSNNNFINEIYKPIVDSSLEKDLRFEAILNENNIVKKYYEQKIIKEGNARIYILNSTSNENYNRLSTNNKSGMIKIVYGENSILFTGDIERKGEIYYSEYYKEFLQCDILKIAHHGSKTSSTEEILNYLKPKIGLISVGSYNIYKHPSASIIDRLKEYKIKLFRTDVNGALLFQSDGKVLSRVNWRD